MTKQNLPEGMTQRGWVYWADFRVNGRRVRKSLSRNLKTAKQLLVELRARVERGDYGLLDNDCGIAELKEEYFRHCRQTKKPGMVERYKQNLAAILPYVPPKVSQLTIQTVLAYREQRLAAGISPATVNMDVHVLSGMINWGVKYGLIGNNPLKGLNRVPHDRPKESRALTKGEVQRLFDASPQHWRDVWYAFLVTGMRASELASLRLSDVDWAARKLVVRRGIAKNHKPRRIPIDNELFRILDTLAKGRPSDRRAFTNTKGGPLNRHPLYQVFMRCCRRAEIQTRTLGPEGLEAEHVDVHSLRRTFATDLIENGADPKTVQDLLGHKTLAMTIALYAKVRPGTKRQAIGRLSSGAGADTPEQPIEFKAG